MGTMGRPKAELKLTNEERDELRRLAGRRAMSTATVLRARIIWRAQEGSTTSMLRRNLASASKRSASGVGAFIERRVAGLLDEPRVGRPRSVLDGDVERIVDITLHEQPCGSTHWSTRSLAARLEVSKDAVHRVWRAFGLRPDRAETFSLSKDPQFVEKVRDIVGLYMSPPESALVLCVDEKSQMQALDRTQPLLPMVRTPPERRTNTYSRH